MNATASSDPPLHPRPLRVLYADDMQALRELFSLVLGRAGHQVETAADGQAALDRIRGDPTAFDLLITDHHMPRLNGLELVRAIRPIAFPGRIIVFSSEINPVVHDEYHRLRVDAVLPKPIFPVTLTHVIRTLFPGPPAAHLALTGS